MNVYNYDYNSFYPNLVVLNDIQRFYVLLPASGKLGTVAQAKQLTGPIQLQVAKVTVLRLGG